MENTSSPRRIHPLLAAAAVSVTLVSLVGVAAITGVIPSSQGHGNPQDPMASGSNLSQPENMTQNIAQNGTAPGDNMRAPVVDRSPYPVDAPRRNSGASHQSAANAGNNQLASTTSNDTVSNQAMCANCGRVEAIHTVQQQAKPSGIGVAAGAVLGGILGHQVGNGNGRTLATVAGAVGGGYAGNEVEKRSGTNTVYQVKVRMDDGSLRTYPQNGWRVGDRVKAVNGALESLG
ncbi:glycine zipper 2TM domain-containing protein [Undibacterium sp. RuTC16W]|uniref:glycine zipper 2TM domain-containing protein n=1 Tax=Undibacterium sp. RuTC16W TaxID=3413048 RepID=UPI003BF33373